MEIQQDFPSFDPQEDDPIQRLEYQQIASASKLEKISGRLTIVSVMIPILILALIAFVYLDMMERVISSDTSKQSQMEEVSSQMTEKLNSLDTRLAKNRHDLDQELPKLTAAIHDLSRKLDTTTANAKKADSRISALGKSKKALTRSTTAMNKSIERIKTQLAGMDTRIKKNNRKNTAVLETIERMNRDLMASIEEAVAETKKSMDERILAMEQQLAGISTQNEETKDLMDKYKNQIAALKTKTAQTMKDLEGHIKRVEISVSAIARSLAGETKKTAPPSKSAKAPTGGDISSQNLAE